MNKAILTGFVGKDPDIHVSENGKIRATFSVATNEGFGHKKITDWHNCLAWNGIAETISKIVKGGARIEIEGKIKYNINTGKAYILISDFFVNSSKDTLPDKENSFSAYNEDDDIPF